MDWYLAVLKQYAVFSGRARRTEYWMFFLINFIISIGLGFLAQVVDILAIVSLLYMLAVLIPSLAVFFRRLHDTGRSGWWWLVGIIPIIGAIVLLVFLVQDSEPGSNKYGPNPKTA
jgi:uncharacterized membrane protein YhaH (DUF805 family)